MTAPNPPSWLEEGETAALLGEWWMIHDADDTPIRMVWAGGRDTYDGLVAEFNEHGQPHPIAFPHTMFNFVSEEF